MPAPQEGRPGMKDEGEKVESKQSQPHIRRRDY